MNKPVEPMIKAARRAYRATKLYEVDRLLAEQTRWLRKRTIAENKLADCRRRIDALLKEVTTPKGEADEPKSKSVQ